MSAMDDDFPRDTELQPSLEDEDEEDDQRQTRVGKLAALAGAELDDAPTFSDPAIAVDPARSIPEPAISIPDAAPTLPRASRAPVSIPDAAPTLPFHQSAPRISMPEGAPTLREHGLTEGVPTVRERPTPGSYPSRPSPSSQPRPSVSEAPTVNYGKAAVAALIAGEPEEDAETRIAHNDLVPGDLRERLANELSPAPLPPPPIRSAYPPPPPPEVPPPPPPSIAEFPAPPPLSVRETLPANAPVLPALAVSLTKQLAAQGTPPAPGPASSPRPTTVPNQQTTPQIFVSVLTACIALTVTGVALLIYLKMRHLW
jgi:hypothetical protein